MNNSTKTFWELIKDDKYKILIPRIQRDYVQGREEEEVEIARGNLLEDIKECFEHNKKIDLNFVYGKEEIRKGIKVFIPLDGQQRLTTLFLLHLYVFLKENNMDKFNELKKSFSYETRLTSKIFFEKIIEEKDTVYEIICNGENISKNIQNKNWFRLEWIYDPTIKSVLVMLDEINEKFKNVHNLSEELVKKTEDNKITFQFLEMKDLDLEDDLYITLNSSGRELTEFDNFKAELIKYLKESTEFTKEFVEKFCEDLDTTWIDKVFWEVVGDKKTEIDKIYIKFLYLMIINHGTQKEEFRYEPKGFADKILNKNNNIRFVHYKNFIDKDIVEEINATLKFFSEQYNESEYVRQYFDKCVTEEVEFFDVVMLKAVSTYLKSAGSNVTKDSFEKWMRIIKHLVTHSRIDGLKEYQGAIKGICELSAKWEDLLKYFSKIEEKISGFAEKQIEEESLKAKLILNGGEDWKNIILEAEEHKYFDGQIAFLFSLINMDKTTNLKLYMEKLKEFKKYKNMVWQLFNENGLAINNNLFHRALLTEGDYLFKSGNGLLKIFALNKNRDWSWNRLLEDNEKREMFKRLIDKLDGNSSDASLEKVISEHQINEENIYYYFEKEEGVLSRCKNNRMYRLRDKNIDILWSGKGPSKTDVEYYTYVILLKLEKLGYNVEYHFENYSSEREYYIEKINNTDVKISYLPNKNNEKPFELIIENEKPMYLSNVKSVIDAIKNKKWI